MNTGFEAVPASKIPSVLTPRNCVLQRLQAFRARDRVAADIAATTTLGYDLPELFLAGHGLRAEITFLTSPLFLSYGGTAPPVAVLAGQVRGHWLRRRMTTSGEPRRLPMMMTSLCGRWGHRGLFSVKEDMVSVQ